jgi:hypothetical protein
MSGGPDDRSANDIVTRLVAHRLHKGKEVTVQTAVAILALLVALVVAITRR